MNPATNASRARTEDWTITGDDGPRRVNEYAASLLTAGKRAPVVRTGEREPISHLVRQLVYRRDGYACRVCGAAPRARLATRRSGPLHLDHIIPWSAGGPDRSDNLRTLCGPCNQQRSNYVTGDEQPSTPIVRICIPCNPCINPNDHKAICAASQTIKVYCGHCSCISWTIATAHIL